MSYKYSLINSEILSESGKYELTYGISVSDSSGVRIAEYCDISPDRSDIKRIISLLSEEEIEPDQLNYIIEDFVSLTFSLE